MHFEYPPQFLKNLTKSPPRIQKIFRKQAALMLQNFRHSSLRIKKYDEANDIWQARVNKDWRFYFKIRGDIYYLLNIRSHPK